MEETLEKPRKAGNPNLKKGTGWKLMEPTDPDKIFEFELINTVDQGKPVDRDNDKVLEAPYPHLFTRPNEGMAYDEQKMVVREWRYITGQPSIWVDEQESLKDLEPREIHKLLGQSENQIEFIQGKCFVRAVDRLKLHALTIHDTFEGKPTQYRKVNRLYRLINPDKLVQQQLDLGDMEYRASKLAHEATEEEMLYGAFTFGIDVSDLSKEGINKIKAQFRAKAKYNAANPKGVEALQFFIDVMENPLTKIKYIISQGFTQGIISTTQQPGKLTWVAPNSAIMDIDTRTNAVDLLCGKILDHDELAMSTFEQIEQELNKLRG